jgi:hypothetical protein
MKRIILEAVPSAAMRPPYNRGPDGGDWFYNAEGDLVIRVIGIDLGTPADFLFALHELVEATLCRREGVSQESVDRFDAAFENMEDRDFDSEPGDHPAAPYRTQHRRAMLIEHMMAQFMGLNSYGRVQ